MFHAGTRLIEHSRKLRQLCKLFSMMSLQWKTSFRATSIAQRRARRLADYQGEADLWATCYRESDGYHAQADGWAEKTICNKNPAWNWGVKRQGYPCPKSYSSWICPLSPLFCIRAICYRRRARLQKPLPFDGCSSWDTYNLQFKMLADVNCWSDAERVTYLAVSLWRSALTVPMNISPDHRGEYATLVAALNKNFSIVH